jgi:UDP-N-acetylmuramate--alanine ligase
MNQKLFENIKKVHLIGIGGIGVSALARMMLLLGKEITGSDISENMVNKRIKRLGGRVFIGHKASNLPKDTDMVIYSPAIKDDNPELILAKKFNIPIYSYPEALGLISKNMKTIAISGTHGKTTITAMLAEVMISAKKSPTVIIGSFLKKQKDNFVLGKNEYFVVEACEYKESFLNLFPDILVIANIDNDHLDYYGSIENIQKAFAKLITKVPKDGFVVCNPNDKNVKQALKIADKKAEVVDYIKEELNIELAVPGEHNIKNAQTVLAVARLIGVKKEQVRKALANYTGVWRRFEYKGKTKKGAFIYDDYAHHPTEVKATLKAAREKFPKKRIIVVFQPHLYSRTKLLLNDFVKSFNQADEIIITDIYAAREKDDGSIHAKDLVERIKKHNSCASYLGDFTKIEKYLRETTNKDDVIITIGAGDVYQIGEDIKG